MGNCGAHLHPLRLEQHDWSVTATTGLVESGLVAVDLEEGDKVELWVRQITGASANLAKVRQFGVRSWA